MFLKVGEDANEGEPAYTVGGMQAGAATLENRMEVPESSMRQEAPKACWHCCPVLSTGSGT